MCLTLTESLENRWEEREASHWRSGGAPRRRTAAAHRGGGAQRRRQKEPTMQSCAMFTLALRDTRAMDGLRAAPT